MEVVGAGFWCQSLQLNIYSIFLCLSLSLGLAQLFILPEN